MFLLDFMKERALLKKTKLSHSVLHSLRIITYPPGVFFAGRVYSVFAAPIYPKYFSASSAERWKREMASFFMRSARPEMKLWIFAICAVKRLGD